MRNTSVTFSRDIRTVTVTSNVRTLPRNMTKFVKEKKQQICEPSLYHRSGLKKETHTLPTRLVIYYNSSLGSH